MAERTLRGVRCLAFEGGGVLGVAYLPVVRALSREGVLAEVTDFAGTSAGAITAALLALGASPAYLDRILRTTDWRVFRGRELMTVRLIRLVRHLGMHSLAGAEAWLAGRFAELGASASLTFGELFARTGHRLYVPATDEGRGTVKTFGPDTPDTPVLRAVLASMAIPLYWPPVDVDGTLYSDGGLTCNHPMHVFDARLPEEVLGIRLDSARELSGEVRQVRGVVGRALRLVSIARARANEAHISKRWWDAGRVLVINTGHYSATDFGLRPAAVADLLDRGEQAVREWRAAECEGPA